ncbi:MAG: hypothetical protein ACI4S4_07445, partial [Candidatus Ornithospirochaeta sp.]
ISGFERIFFRLRKWEAAAVFYRVFEGEDPEDFRPGYDYGVIQEEMAEVNKIIRYFKSLVSNIKANVYFNNDMTIDEMEMLKADLKAKVRRLEGIMGKSTPSCGDRAEDCRSLGEEIVRKDYESSKSELEDISEGLEYIYGNTIFSIDGDEEDWEEIVRAKNAHLDSVIDKDLWEDFNNALLVHFSSISLDPGICPDPEKMALSESQNPWGLVPWWN